MYWLVWCSLTVLLIKEKSVRNQYYLITIVSCYDQTVYAKTFWSLPDIWGFLSEISANSKIPLWNYNSITIIQQHLIIYAYQLTFADLWLCRCRFGLWSLPWLQQIPKKTIYGATLHMPPPPRGRSGCKPRLVSLVLVGSAHLCLSVCQAV